MKLGSGQSSTRGLRFNVVAIEYPKQSRLAVRAQIGFHPQGETSPPALLEYPRFAEPAGGRNHNLLGSSRPDEAGFSRFRSVSTPNAAKIIRHGSIGTEYRPSGIKIATKTFITTIGSQINQDGRPSWFALLRPTIASAQPMSANEPGISEFLRLVISYRM